MRSWWFSRNLSPYQQFSKDLVSGPREVRVPHLRQMVRKQMACCLIFSESHWGCKTLSKNQNIQRDTRWISINFVFEWTLFTAVNYSLYLMLFLLFLLCVWFLIPQKTLCCSWSPSRRHLAAGSQMQLWLLHWERPERRWRAQSLHRWVNVKCENANLKIHFKF